MTDLTNQRNKRARFIALAAALPILGAMAVTLMEGTVASAQDDALGALPPVPDLDLGDPTEKKGLFKKVKSSQQEKKAQRRENKYVRPAEQGPEPTFGQRMTKAMKGRPRNAPTEESITVVNKIPSSESAMTASGELLKPFGEEEDYWGDAMMATVEEDPFGLLAPMPDFRTPDQISKKERLRNEMVARQERRKAEQEAKRLAKEMANRPTVQQPPPDPSSALIQVQSRRDAHDHYHGNVEAPETPNNRQLKAFDPNATYVQGNQVVYRGSEPITPAMAWWRRGIMGEGEADPQEPKWRWRNPFATNREVPGGTMPEPQPAAYHGGGGGAHSAQTYTNGDPALDATPLTSHLRGILIVRGTQDVTRSGLGGISGVQTRGVDLPERVEEVFQSRVGRSLTLGGLNQMVREAVLAYRRSDLPVVDVLVPEQEITSGVLQLVIIEGRLGNVVVEGASEEEAETLSRQIHMNRGEVIRESQLLEDLNWINRHPTRQVDLIYSPGGGYGETDIILRSEEYQEFSTFFAYENSGTALLGESRAIFGASWAGPIFFDLNSIFSYQFTTNFDNDNDLWGHSGVFSTYLPWRHQLTLLGAYTSSNAQFSSGENILFDTTGTNKQGSLRYAIPLPTFARVAHEIEFGMDFKSSNTDLAFNQARVFDTTSEIVQYSLGYNILARDDSGAWKMDLEVVGSPGDNTSKNTDAIFAEQRAGASADYTYGRIVIERDQKLGGGWDLWGRIQGQVSNDNLLASETLGAGGYDTVRGFEQRVIRGDRGIIGNLELRTPTFYPSGFSGFQNVRDAARGVIFYDYASLASEMPLPGEVDRSIGSAGVGLRYQLEDWFTLRVDYGVQVSETGVDDGESGRWHIGARATF